MTACPLAVIFYLQRIYDRDNSSENIISCFEVPKPDVRGVSRSTLSNVKCCPLAVTARGSLEG